MRLRVRPRRQHSVEDETELRSALTRFLLVGLASLVLVAIPTALLFQNIDQERALQGAIEHWRVLSTHLLGPEATSGVIARDQAALAQLDANLGHGTREGSILRIKIWDATGRVLYSDQSALIGRVYPLPEAATLLDGTETSIASISSLSEHENEFERGRGLDQMVEVYTLAKASNGEPIIVEAYFPTTVYNQEHTALLAQMAPVGLAGLLILNLAQLPSAVNLARLVQRGRQSRERLLVQSVAAADRERRKLARELHDEVIQDLAGVGYALSSLEEHIGVQNRPVVGGIGVTVCRDVARLRAIVTRLYPRELDPGSLTGSLNDLGDVLRQAGARVQVHVDEQLHLDQTAAILIYRVARECLRNVAKHAQPRNVMVRLIRVGPRTVLTVVDDGAGFDHSAEPPVGYHGLQLIKDVVTEAGGTLVVDSSVSQGTRVELSLPAAERLPHS